MKSRKRYVTSEKEMREALEERANWIDITQPFNITETINLNDYSDPWPMRWDSSGPHSTNIVRKTSGPAFQWSYRRLILDGVSIVEDPRESRSAPLIESGGMYLSLFINCLLYGSGGDGIYGGHERQFDTTKFFNTTIDRCEGSPVRLVNGTIQSQYSTYQRNGEPLMVEGGGENPETTGPNSFRSDHFEDNDVEFRNLNNVIFTGNYLWESDLVLHEDTEGCLVAHNTLYDNSNITDLTKRTVNKITQEFTCSIFGFASEVISDNIIKNNIRRSIK